MKWISWLIWIGLSIGLTSCAAIPNTGRDQASELVIFAAASLTDSFTELAIVFEEQNPSTNLVLHFASSSHLVAQLREGVDADIFASANPYQMQAAVDNQRVEERDVHVFAANTLTIIVPKGNPAGIHSLQDLGETGVTLLMAVHGVPVREYANQIISGLQDSTSTRIYTNLVSEESNVRQVVTKVALGEADAGIVYQSDITPDIVDRVEQIQIPDSMNVMATYPISVVEDSQHKEVAIAFVDFVLSEAGQKILAEWGFIPISTNVANEDIKSN